MMFSDLGVDQLIITGRQGDELYDLGENSETFRKSRLTDKRSSFFSHLFVGMSVADLVVRVVEGVFVWGGVWIVESVVVGVVGVISSL